MSGAQFVPSLIFGIFFRDAGFVAKLVGILGSLLTPRTSDSEFVGFGQTFVVIDKQDQLMAPGRRLLNAFVSPSLVMPTALVSPIASKQIVLQSKVCCFHNENDQNTF